MPTKLLIAFTPPHPPNGFLDLPTTLHGSSGHRGLQCCYSTASKIKRGTHTDRNFVAKYSRVLHFDHVVIY